MNTDAGVNGEEFPEGPEEFELRDVIGFCTVQNSVPEDGEDVEDKYREAVGQCKEQGDSFGDYIFCELGFGFCLHAGYPL